MVPCFTNHPIVYKKKRSHGYSSVLFLNFFPMRNFIFSPFTLLLPSCLVKLESLPHCLSFSQQVLEWNPWFERHDSEKKKLLRNTCGRLGNRSNSYFSRRVRREGVEYFRSLIQRWLVVCDSSYYWFIHLNNRRRKEKEKNLRNLLKLIAWMYTESPSIYWMLNENRRTPILET